MRLIDADALIAFERFDYEVTGEEHTANDILLMIKTAPTIDAVPVVRCKDCKFWEDGWIGYCTKCHTAMDCDSFCSYGERRSDGNL